MIAGCASTEERLITPGPKEIRFEAARRVQAGEAPAAVAQDMGLYTNRIFIWLVAYRAGGWDALRAKKAMSRPKRADARRIHGIYDTVTLKSPLQVKLPPCAVDTRPDPHPDPEEIWGKALPGVGGKASGPARAYRPEATLLRLPAGCLPGGALAERGIPENPDSSPAREGRDLLRG